MYQHLEELSSAQKKAKAQLALECFSELGLASVSAVFKRYLSTGPCDLYLVRPHSLVTLENQQLSASVLQKGSIHVKVVV